MKPIRTYYGDGQVASEIWINEAGQQHRLDGPSYRWWHKNRQLGRESWCLNGEFHRLDGPAYKGWYKSGRVCFEQLYINGVRYNTEAEFLVAVDLYKANEIAELF